MAARVRCRRSLAAASRAPLRSEAQARGRRQRQDAGGLRAEAHGLGCSADGEFSPGRERTRVPGTARLPLASLGEVPRQGIASFGSRLFAFVIEL